MRATIKLVPGIMPRLSRSVLGKGRGGDARTDLCEVVGAPGSDYMGFTRMMENNMEISICMYIQGYIGVI